MSRPALHPLPEVLWHLPADDREEVENYARQAQRDAHNAAIEKVAKRIEHLTRRVRIDEILELKVL